MKRPACMRLGSAEAKRAAVRGESLTGGKRVTLRVCAPVCLQVEHSSTAVAVVELGEAAKCSVEEEGRAKVGPA